MTLVMERYTVRARGGNVAVARDDDDGSVWVNGINCTVREVRELIDVLWLALADPRDPPLGAA